MLAFIFAEYYIGLKEFLRCGEMEEKDTNFFRYQQSLRNIKALIDYLYFVFIQNLDVQQGETTHYYKLFLHVTYEVESAVYFLKDMITKEKDRVMDQLKKDMNKERRKFEKVYFEFNMTTYFEKLLSWFEERSQDM